MSVASLSVNRPVTVLMLFLGVILLGLISWTKLPQELFPSITYPQITVVTSYENAAPEEIESLITKIVEEAVGTVNNVKRISSISKEGSSLVMVEFNWGTNMDFAALNVREKIDLIKERLPREAKDPIVMKYNPFDLPVANLAVTGPMTPLDLREMCRKYVKDAIEKVEGVASATITGGEEREILVEIDQPRLRASQISIVSIVESLKSANLNYPAGTIKEAFYEYLIRTMGEYQTIAEIKDTPAALDIPEEKAKTVKEKEKEEAKGRRLVYLKDIATVKDTVKEKTSISRYMGADNVSLVIRKQSGTNTLSVVNGIKREIRSLLAAKLPKGVKIQMTYDQSVFIKEAIGNVRNAGVMGAILAFIVLFVFLWELKAALIITAAIPLCITATAVLMYFSGINLNMMSLGGLALGVGMVIDNANIVIENIFRYRLQLKAGFQESIVKGTGEMTSAIIGSTLTNIAVFLPFVFVVGIAGQIFKQLSFTISFSLIASIIVAVSLVPVLVLICGESKRDERISRKVESVTDEFTGRFQAWFTGLMQQKLLIVGVVGILFALSLITLFSLDREFMPRVDQRQFIIKVDLAPGTRLEITDTVARKLERTILALPETKDCTVNIGSSEEKDSPEKSALQTMGSHQAQILVNLHKKGARFRRSTDAVIQYLKSYFEGQNMEDAELEYIAQETSLGSAVEQGAPVVVEIKGPDLNKLMGYASLLQNQLKTVPGIYGIKMTMAKPSPETKLNIRKDKASLYGLSVRDIAVTTQVALKGYVATKFKEKNVEEDVDIRVRLRPQDRSDFGKLQRLLIHSPTGADVAMSDLAYLAKGRGPTEIKRIDQQRSVVVTANIYNRNFADVARDINSRIAALQKKHIPAAYTVDLAGEQQKMQESFASLAFALIMAILLVYMIMAAEFESLWQPLLIMFTVPLSLIGVAFTLLVTRTSLNVVAYLGIIMLGGITVNNGIVLIEFINALRKKGYTAEEAVIEATRTRLRPILMTSGTTILGLVPLALGIGEGSELQAPLALTVLGGLISATFLTLVFVPALYVLVEDKLSSIPFFRKTDRLGQPEEKPEETRPSTAELPSEQSASDLLQEAMAIDATAPGPAASRVQARPLIDASAAEIANIRQALEEKEAAFQELQKQIQVRQAGMASQAMEKEKQLNDLKRQLQEKETALAGVKRDMQSAQEQAKAAADAGALSADKEKEIEAKLRHYTDEEQRLKALAEQLETQQQDYQKTSIEKEHQIEDMRRLLSDKETSLAELQQQIERQKRNLEILLRQKDEELAALEQKAAEEKVRAEEEKQRLIRERDEGSKKARAQGPRTHAPFAKPQPSQPAAELPEEPAAGASTAGPQELNPRQVKLLEKFQTVERITRKEYADMLSISIPTAARDLKELVSRKILVARGPLGPGRWYELNK
ncbi:MAG: efflux RND transporter permease subunit [Candidatus Omnitrophica bacterium]|nr:efflux RND transporter permease subunit [Candidatus Omnitrophota bacterium]